MNERSLPREYQYNDEGNLLLVDAEPTSSISKHEESHGVVTKARAISDNASTKDLGIDTEENLPFY